MINFKNTMLGITASLLTVFGTHAENVILHTPGAFQALSMSPNGKWACGVFIDGGMSTHGFRWNLESGNIELLDIEASTAWDIADDGTVSGDFTDHEALDNGAPTSMPGFWRDGAWHHIEMPVGSISDGIGGCISPDGQFMTGAICVNGIYSPYIWKNGSIHRDLSTGSHAVGMAVAPDGNGAAGYNTQYNRTACYWTPSGELVHFTDSKEMSQSPWNYARNFSPDGNKLLYWGGWELDDAQNLFLYSVYDITTGTRKKVQAPSYDSDLEFFDISNSETLVGANQTRGYVWADGKGMYIDDYLAARGVDLSSFDGFYGQGDYYSHQLPINRVVAISGDDSVILVNYYDTVGESRSMAIKIDQDLSKLTPVELSARQLTGLNTVGITWQRPVGGNSIRGYNVYRDGKKINGIMPVNVPYYYDRKAAPGTYQYTVGAIMGGNTENTSEPVTVTVGQEPVQAPTSILARQKGINGVFAAWTEPMSALVHKRYFDPAKIDTESFSVYGEIDVELAVRFDKNEMANYSGYKVAEVSFCPTEEQKSWTLNFYTHDADGALQLLASQPITQALKYHELNTVKLDSPLDIPAGDLIAAIEVSTQNETQHLLGRQSGNVKAAYSDLLRLKFEDNFYSAYESSLEGALYITSLSWAIDLGLKGDADAAPASLSHYSVYIDGESAGDTTDLRYTLDDIADGTHTIGVEAVYADGAVSERILSTLDIKAAYQAINDVEVTPTETEVKAVWAAPVDCDATDVSYTNATRHSTGIKGNSENSFAIMAGAIYPSSMLKGYDGYRVKSFRFYPLADAIFTFILTADGKEVAYHEVEDFTLDQWNEVILPDDVYIDGNAEYVLALDCFDPEPDVPLLALDNAAPRPNVSDLYSTDFGETWQSLTTETGTYGNWMMGIVIVDNEERPVNVDGYDVVIDNTVRNTSKLTDTEFTYNFGATDNKNHRLRVDVYYPAKTKAVTGSTTTFKLEASGINDAYITSIKLNQGTNYLHADGDGIEALSIYDTAGALVAYADGDTADISALTPGIYVVQIKAYGTALSRKISIIK